MRKIISLAVVGLLSGVSSTWADVAVTSRITSTGWAGWGASEGTTVEMLKGLRSRHEYKSKNTGAILGKVTRAGDSVTLTLLDTEVIDQLNVRKKTYTEQTLQSLRDAFKEATDKKSSSPEPEKSSPPTHRISRAEFKVRATGATRTINTYPCKEYVLEMLLEIEDLKTHEKSRTRMVADTWTTPETAAMKQLRQEQAAFAQAYMKKMDIEFSTQEMNRFGTQMAAMLTGAGHTELNKAMQRIPQEMKQVTGYPILTKVDWYLEESAAPNAKTKSSSAAEEDTAIDVTQGVTGALGGLASNWAKKKTAQKIDEHNKAQEGKPLISVTTEVESVAADPLGEDSFKVPAGYKKVDRG